MKKAIRPKLPPDLQAITEALTALPDESIDLAEMPEVADWSDAIRGKFYRPVKQQLTLRLDADVVHWFRTHAQGGGYQTRINRALRSYVEQHERKRG